MPSATRCRPLTTRSRRPPPPVRPAASMTRRRGCPSSPPPLGRLRERCSGRGPATCARNRYTVVDAFYHQLCPECAALNRAKRDAQHRPHRPQPLCSPAAAPRFGMYSRVAAAPRRRAHHHHHPLFRTTPCAASPRCPTPPTGCTGCASLASTCATRLRSSRSPTRWPSRAPLDILINNAAQTVRRPPGSYAALVEAERTRPPELVDVIHVRPRQ